MAGKRFFPLDYNILQDDKILQLRLRYGPKGFGLYLALLELLWNNEDLVLETDFKTLAFLLRVKPETVREVVCDFDLFSLDDESGTFTSRAAIKRKRVLAGIDPAPRRVQRYISHDLDSFQDLKISRLRQRWGVEGFGAYWMIVMTLFNAPDHTLQCSYEALALLLRLRVRMIKSIVEDFGLFKMENGRFWSDSMLRRVKTKEEAAIKRESTGKRPVGAPKGNQNARKRDKKTTREPELFNSEINSENNPKSIPNNSDNNCFSPIPPFKEQEKNNLNKNNNYSAPLLSPPQGQSDGQAEKKLKDNFSDRGKPVKRESAEEQKYAREAKKAHQAALKTTQQHVDEILVRPNLDDWVEGEIGFQKINRKSVVTKEEILEFLKFYPVYCRNTPGKDNLRTEDVFTKNFRAFVWGSLKSRSGADEHNRRMEKEREEFDLKHPQTRKQFDHSQYKMTTLAESDLLTEEEKIKYGLIPDNRLNTMPGTFATA